MTETKAETAAQPHAARQQTFGLNRSCLAFTNIGAVKTQSLFAADPRRLTNAKAMYLKSVLWPQGHTIKVQWLGGTPEQRDFVRKTVEQNYFGPQLRLNLHLEWDAPADQADVRVSFEKEGGAWSYMGTQAWGVAAHKPTMNLGWLDEAFNGAVVIHEWGHCWGLGHEHQSYNAHIDWADDQTLLRVFGGPPNHWDLSEVHANITALMSTSQYNGSAFDENSIMLYIFDCACFKRCQPPQRPRPLPCTCGALTDQICTSAWKGSCSPSVPIQRLSPTDMQVLGSMYPPGPAPTLDLRQEDEAPEAPKACDRWWGFILGWVLVAALLAAVVGLAIGLARAKAQPTPPG